MDASSASWTRIPRDYHEQQRLQLEHRLYASTARSNDLGDDHSSFKLEEEDLDNDLNNREEDGLDAYNSEEDEGRRSPLHYSSSEFSMEYPRNPQVAADDYSLSNPHRHRRHSQPREGDTKSTFAHHASAVTFRTGLRGTRDSRDFSRGLSALSIDYDPDRSLDALLRRASDLSILQDSPRDTPKSEFTTRAQGLAKQMAENSNPNGQQPSSSNKKSGSFSAANVTLKPIHRPLSELARNVSTPLKPAFQTTRLFPAYAQTTGRIQLPDVTGLTSAVATPLKGDASFRRVPDPKPSSAAFASRFRHQTAPTSSKPVASSSNPEKDTQPTATTSTGANTAAALDTLSHRLQQIERESLTSRRRVAELERELDMCRGVVDQERTRMGELSARSMRAGTSRRRGHGNFLLDGKSTRGKRGVKADLNEVDAAVLDDSFRETQRRYREAVGEEKELEALVKALHSHLRRTSQTVESHKQMIDDLRAEAQRARASRLQPSSLRSDTQEAGRIWDEVERVKSEVELLWGDVGRLRGVVEGGLGLRRARGGGIGDPADGGDVVAGSVVRGDSLRDMSEHEDEFSNAEEQHDEEQREQKQEQAQEEEYEDDGRPEWVPRKPGEPVLSAVLEEDEPASTRASGRSIAPHPHPHQAPAPATTGRFIQEAELERVRAEVEERRSLRSQSMSGSGSDRSEATAMGVRSRALGRVLDANGGRVSPTPTSRVASSSKLPTGARHGLQQHIPPRPLTPDSEGDAPAGGKEQQRNGQQQQQRAASPSSSPALPQIRGERLERLFYAAPEHNSRTCGVCHRRQRMEGHAGHIRSSSGTAHAPALAVGADEIMFGEGSEQRIAEIAKKSGVPPQTVLARVLRELEDDFTHYKSIYVELADQYKAMDAASDMGKRNLLANHLREVIDVLEQKGDQIASLYDLLHFEDKPLAAPKASSSRHHHHHARSRRTRLS